MVVGWFVGRGIRRVRVSQVEWSVVVVVVVLAFLYRKQESKMKLDLKVKLKLKLVASLVWLMFAARCEN